GRASAQLHRVIGARDFDVVFEFCSFDSGRRGFDRRRDLENGRRRVVLIGAYVAGRARDVWARLASLVGGRAAGRVARVDRWAPGFYGVNGVWPPVVEQRP